MYKLTKEETSILREAKAILYKKAKQTSAIFTDSDKVAEYLLIDFNLEQGFNEREHFKCLFLDNQHRLIKNVTMFSGTVDASPVYPRVVVQEALKHNAAAVIFAHNHPSGDTAPSQADRNITDRLVQSLMLVDIKVLDHFVVGLTETTSFADRGWL